MDDVIAKIESAFIPTTDNKNAFSRSGMVTSQSPHASEAGAAMLKSGGNAVDAAIATAMALAVAEPQASGLGGQTMMLIHQDGKVLAVDGSSRAPSLAHVSALYKQDRSVGYRAATIPSTPATLWYIHDRYGQLKWEQVLEPAIALAKEGYKISPLQSRLLEREKGTFEKVESRSGLAYYYNQGLPYKSGEIFKQQDLAETLTRLSRFGIEDFYRGKIAKEIDGDMRENGGLLRRDDLALIPFPIERDPLMRPFRGLDVYTMPPPGSGRSLLYALMMNDLLPQEVELKDPLQEYLLFSNILRKVFVERSDRPFDPNFFKQTEQEQDMLDPLFARECLMEILHDIDKSVLPFIPTGDELTGETTHLSVIDKKGMAISLTQSIERVYGSKAAAAGLGFLYNNYMYDFDFSDPEHPFYLRPNSVPWATVAPSMVFHKDKLWMVMGSPGSERIISSLTLFLMNMLDKGMSLREAVEAPRLHCSLGGRVSLEESDFPESLIPYLEYKGFRIDKRGHQAFYLGCIQAVIQMTGGKGFQGSADPRRDGTAVGL